MMLNDNFISLKFGNATLDPTYPSAVLMRPCSFECLVAVETRRLQPVDAVRHGHGAIHTDHV
jgi:hypothetical protein